MTGGEFLVLVLALVLAWPAVGVVRFVRCSPAARRHYPGMWRARLRWRWLARHLGLARLEVLPKKGVSPAKFKYPRGRFRLDPYGWTVQVRTIPRTGRRELDQAVDHLANSWRCHRVSVVQVAPGRLLVRAMRRDPLAEPYPADAVPAGVYGRSEGLGNLPRPSVPRRLYVGKDGFGEHRWLPLGRSLTGITVSGMPGTGKTTLLHSWLAQLAGSPAVTMALADNKGSDLECWRDRAWLYSDDSLEDTLSLLEDAHSEMRRRLGCVLEVTGRRNAWAAGLSESWPLLLVAIDECATSLDISSYRGDVGAERMARRCVRLAGQLIRKGGSVAVVTVLVTQRATVDSFGSGHLRDNASASFAFGLRTIDAAVCALGEEIREYQDTYSPVQHRDNVGVCTSTLPTSRDPFSLIRTPELTEEAVAERALATASMRRDPAANPKHVSDLVAAS